MHNWFNRQWQWALLFWFVLREWFINGLLWGKYNKLDAFIMFLIGLSIGRIIWIICIIFF